MTAPQEDLPPVDVACQVGAHDIQILLDPAVQIAVMRGCFQQQSACRIKIVGTGLDVFNNHIDSGIHVRSGVVHDDRDQTINAGALDEWIG